MNRLKLDWKPALAARVIEGEDVLEVQFEKTIRAGVKIDQ